MIVQGKVFRMKLLGSVFALTLGFLAIPSFAQEQNVTGLDTEDMCQVVYEGIVPMRTPNFDQVAMWKRTLGVQGIDLLRSVMRVADGGVIFVGEGQPYYDDHEKKGLGDIEIEMGRLSKDGKILTQSYVSVEGLTSVVDGVLQKTRIVVLSHLRRKDQDFIGLFYLDGKGEKREEQLVSDKDRDLIPVSFVPLSSGGKIVLSRMHDRQSVQKDLSSTGVVWIEENGKIRTIKEYLPGIKTIPSRIRKGADGALIITGRVLNEKGSDAGWLLKIGTDGSMDFQQQFSRGLNATLRDGISASDGAVVAIGDAIPAGEGDKAGWVVKTDSTGKIIWQKFLTGKYSYTAVDMVLLEDGRIMTLWAASPTSFGGRRFARLVTFSPEGTILFDESYLEGTNSVPFRLIADAKQRVIAGVSETGFAEEQKSGRDEFISYDNWVMALPELPSYHNPCAASKPKILDVLP
ncbi:MAG: hypothetical protein KDJ50_00545 [Alphaproteobacteria bacterium]|nr:hypothetical protein [Alphaproteobacteria bacterium]